MSKNCEICKAEIPDDFQTLLCLECYAKIAKTNEQAKKERAKQEKQRANSAINPKNIPSNDPIGSEEAKIEAVEAPESLAGSKFGIDDPNYKENPEMDDKQQILANLAQFIYSHDPEKGRKGKMLWYPTRNMYNFIKNYCMKRAIEHPQYPKSIWKPKIVDVGCGSGVGSNIMSQEADFVWGIDKNEFSIEFAKECFTRIKNGIYYNSEVRFDVIDILTENRFNMNFDIVVAIEIIEHIHDTHTFLTQLINRFTKRKKGDCHIDYATEFFISTPNRNSPKIQKDTPKNPYHCREWTSEEFWNLLSNYFEEIEFMDNKGVRIEKSCNDDLILAKCKYPKLCQ